MQDLNNKKVIFRSPVCCLAGYGVHARQIAVMLDKLAQKYHWDMYFQATPWGTTPFLLGDYAERSIVEKYSKPYTHKEKADIALTLALPNEWDANLAGYNIGITAAVETDRCNSQWVDCCNKMNMVIVPSQHTKRTVENSGKLNKTIFVIGESFKPEFFKEDLICDLDLDFDTNWNFLVLGQITGDMASDRKNIGNTVKWFCEEFAGDKNIGLVLKTNSASNSKIDRQITTANIKQLIQQLRKGEYPKIHILHGPMRDDEIAKLYKHPKIKAFLLPTRGEGMCLPALESAASGLPMLLTDWSGHKDIIDLIDKSCVRLSYSLCPIPQGRVDPNIFVFGSRWAEPHADDVKRKMRKIYESYDIPCQWAKDLQIAVRQVFHPDNIYKQFEKLIESDLVK